jgi:hypothetical protein
VVIRSDVADTRFAALVYNKLPAKGAILTINGVQ